MFNYTNQPLKSAIVPLMIGGIPNVIAPYEQGRPWTARSEKERGMMEQWNAIYGVYTYRAAECGGEPRYVETSMLITNWLHDFCGGQMASSARITFSGSSNNWDRIDPWSNRNDPLILGRCGETLGVRSALRNTKVPSVNDALRIERPLLESEVRAIMERSIMAVALSELYAHAKRGLIAFDRTAETGRCATRDVLLRAKELTFIPSQPITRNYALWQRFHMLAEAPADTDVRPFFGIRTPYGFSGTLWNVPVSVHVQECAEWRNANSGNDVSPIQVYFSTADRDEDDENFREEYDEESDEYVIVPTGEVDRAAVPDWFTSCVTTAGYAKLWPCGLFSNG